MRETLSAAGVLPRGRLEPQRREARSGIDHASLGCSLKTAAAENTLPCSRTPLLQGFYPAAVSTWGQNGGIPEDEEVAGLLIFSLQKDVLTI